MILYNNSMLCNSQQYTKAVVCCHTTVLELNRAHWKHKLVFETDVNLANMV